MIRRQQTVSQRKGLKSKTKTQKQIISDHYYAQAREEVASKWQTKQLGMVILLLVAMLSLSHFTEFRSHVTQWIITGVFPINDWVSMAIYVIGFIIVVSLFIWGTKKLDKYVDKLINERHRELLDTHYMVDEE